MIVQVNPRSLLNAFFRQSRKFLVVFFFFVAVGVAYILIAPPGYEAETYLLVKFGRDATPDISNTPQSPPPEVQSTERHEIVESNVQLLESRDLAEALLNQMGIARVYPGIVENPPTEGTLMDAAVHKLDEKDLVIKTDQETDVIHVSLFNGDPEVATEELKRLIDLFVAKQSQVYSNPQTGFLREQAEAARKKLAESTAALYDYKAKANVASAEEELSLLLQQRSGAATDLSQHQAAEAESKARVDNIAASLQSLPKDVSTSVEADRFRPMDDARANLNALHDKLDQMLLTYDPSSVVVKNMRETVASAEADYQRMRQEVAERNKPSPNTVYQSMQTDYLRASADHDAEVAQVRTLTQTIADLDKQIADLDERKSHYDDLDRQVHLDEDNYKALQERAAESGVAEDLNRQKITSIAVIQQPTLPYKPTRPRVALVLFLCVFAGLTFGLGTCVLAENVDEAFSIPEQVSAVLGLPVLAAFADRSKGRRRRGRAASGKA